MSSSIALPGRPDGENRVLNHLVDQLNGFRPFNETVDAFYDADKRFRARHNGIIPGEYWNLGLSLGWAQKGVDALAGRCNLDGYSWDGGDLEDLGFSTFADENHLTASFSQAATSSLIHASSFAVASQKAAEGEPESMVHFADSSDATGDWNPRLRRLDNLLWVSEWDAGDPTALTLYLDGRTITAVKDGRWSVVDVSEHSFGVPAGILPFKPRLKRPFGRSRLSRPVRGLIAAAVRELVRLEGHMDAYASPEFLLLGADLEAFQEDGSATGAFNKRLGRWKAIPDDLDVLEGDAPNMARASAQQFPAASPEPHLAAFNMYSKALARELALPDSAVAITDYANPTSAESYDGSQYELITEAERATDDWAPGLNRVVRIALAMRNGEVSVPDAYKSLKARFRDPRYVSRAAQADAGAKIIGAIPELAETRVGLELLGLTPDQVDSIEVERRRGRIAAQVAALVPPTAEEVPGEV